MRIARILATAALTTVAGVAFAAPAFAATASLNPDHVGKTAGYFEQDCDDTRFKGLDTDEDGWHFVLPGGGSFTSLTVTFDPDGVADADFSDDVVYTGSDFTYYGAGAEEKHAYLFTPAGYAIVSGTAGTTSGTSFNVSHACTGTKGSPSPSASVSPSTSTSTSPSTSPSAGQSTTPGTSQTPSVSPSPGGELAVTGTAIGGIVFAGVALLGGGVALMAVRRRRNLTEV